MGVGSLWDLYSIYRVVDAEAAGSRRQRNKREGLVGREIRQVSFARRQSEGAREQGRELKERVARETGACAAL